MNTILTESRILLVEDEPDLLKLEYEFLKEAGFKDVDCASNGMEAYRMSLAKPYHLAVLDIMMPELDGFALFERWRDEQRDLPVIFLSAKDADRDRIKGLGLGADDYITKPFLPEELILRIRAVLKRTGNLKEELLTAQIGKRIVRFEEGVIESDETEVALTAKELTLLKILCENRGRIIQTGTLMERMWPEGTFGYENSLMVHIRRLREKIEDNPSEPVYLQTVRGLGYRLKKEENR